MKREFDGKVKLTGVGHVDGIKAEKLIVGDEMAVTYGYSEKIIKIEDVSKSYILVTFEYESMCTNKTEIAEKKIKKDRIVPIVKLYEEVEKNELDEQIKVEENETFENIEKEIEEIEKELFNNIGIESLISGTGFDTITLECITPFDCGRFKVKKGHRMTLDARIWNKYKEYDYIESCGAVHPKTFYKIIQDSIVKTEYENKLYNTLIELYKKSNILLGI